MTLHSRSAGDLVPAVLALVLFAALSSGRPASADIVNIDATLYGYNPGQGPIPSPGQIISPFSDAAGGALDQLTLGPGAYSVTNATGLAGANPDFTAWRFDSGSTDWVWNYVIADDATDVVVNGGGFNPEPSQAAVAADPNVQSYYSTFTLPTTTTLDFMIKDYYLPDNAGGVALQIQPLGSPAVPESSSFALLGVGLLPLVLMRRRKVARG